MTAPTTPAPAATDTLSRVVIELSTIFEPLSDERLPPQHHGLLRASSESHSRRAGHDARHAAQHDRAPTAASDRPHPGSHHRDRRRRLVDRSGEGPPSDRRRRRDHLGFDALATAAQPSPCRARPRSPSASSTSCSGSISTRSAVSTTSSSSSVCSIDKTSTSIPSTRRIRPIRSTTTISARSATG